MKPAKALLFSALLLSLAAVASAAETTAPATTDAQAAVELTAAQPEVATAVTTPNCDASTDSPLFQTAFDKGAASLGQTCGSCSTSNCRGALRGQMCWINGYGWGHCNIFSGGNICSTGGWECQCGAGDLP